jgi:hypothetical protein
MPNSRIRHNFHGSNARLPFQFCRILGYYRNHLMQTVRFTFLNDKSLHIGAVNTPRDKAFLAVVVFDAEDGDRKVVSSSVVAVSVSAMKRISNQGFAECKLEDQPLLKQVIIEHFRRQDERVQLALNGQEMDYFNNGAGLRTPSDQEPAPAKPFLVQ